MKATFGSGCFWCSEDVFMKVKGVTSTAVGYMGGKLENPTYEDVCTDRTGHAEVVRWNTTRRSFRMKSCLLRFGAATIQLL
jgi:methionine-S-sulfoxide reductase